MELKNSHGGYEGLSISEKIQHSLDQLVAEQAHHIKVGTCAGSCPISNFRRGGIDRLSFVLGLMRNTSTESELHDARMRWAGKVEGTVGVEPGAFPGDDEEGVNL